MAHDADMGAENSARANGRLVREIEDVHAAIAREIAWHEKLFDDSWEEVMKAPPGDIDAMLSEAEAPAPSAGGQRADQMVFRSYAAVASRALRSMAAVGSGLVDKARRRLPPHDAWGRGFAPRPLWLGGAALVVAVLALQLLLFGRTGGGEGGGGIESEASWRRAYGGTAGEAAQGAGSVRLAAAPASAAPTRASTPLAKSGDAALLVTSLLAPSRGTSNVTPRPAASPAGQQQAAVAKSGRPEPATQLTRRR
jgi:hypothetical protein